MSPEQYKPISLDGLLQDADTLPAFPNVVTDILQRIEDPFSVPEDFTDIILRDQVLVSKILKFANSAYYGFPREIVTLKEAIIILGLDTLKSIVLAISAYPGLHSQFHGYGLSPGDLYQHSIATATIARLLAKKQRKENREKYFIAALLHDVGKLLLDPYVARQSKEILTCIHDGRLSLEEAEKRVLGFDHCFVGSRLAELWNLPEVLVQVISFHHAPDQARPPFRPLVDLIYAANLLTYRVKPGVGLRFIQDFDDLVLINRFLPLYEEEAERLVQEARSHLKHISSFL